MADTHRNNRAIEFKPLTSERWSDFELLFGRNGACGGCWCMWWRLTRSEFNRRKGQPNKEAMKAVVESGETPGILAYVEGKPIGWCAVAPRERYPVLSRSRILKPIDNTPVWSITCFFVAKEHRRKGVTVQLLRAAIAHVKRQGGKVVEGYPIEPKTSTMPAAFVWTGLSSAFRQAGFVERTRRSETRPIMRYDIDQNRKRK
jgi:GNAT superfamily N-acetyltransferase